MGAKYSGSQAGVAAAADKSVVYAVAPATSPMRLRFAEFLVSSDDTPADQAARMELRQVTDENASPGGTTITPTVVDEGDPAARATCIGNATNAPTGTVPVLMASVNQRATFRWVAIPGWEIVTPAAEDNGLNLAVAAATSTQGLEGTLFWEE